MRPFLKFHRSTRAGFGLAICGTLDGIRHTEGKGGSAVSEPGQIGIENPPRCEHSARPGSLQREPNQAYS